jgi:hypothetical protein
LANALSDFFLKLIDADNPAAQQVVGTTELIGSVYTDFDAKPVAKGETINVVFPGAVAWSDVGNSGFTPADVDETTKALQLNAHPAASFKITDFEALRTLSGNKIREVYLDPAFKAGAEFLNGVIAASITTANFTNTPIATQTNNTVTRTQTSKAWAALTKLKVPTSDFANMSLLTHSDVYANMLDDNNFVNQSVVGDAAAADAVRRANLGQKLGAQVKYDQQMPITSGTVQYISLYMHRYAMGLVLRPLASPDASALEVTYIKYRGIPIRVMLSYQHLLGAHVMSFDFAYALTVLRPTFGVIIQSTKA